MTPDETDPWLARRLAALARTELAPQSQALGRVERIADGIALVSGLPDTGLGELLRFEGGRQGFALTLDVGAISAVLLDDGAAVGAGSAVSGTGEVVRVPVGPGLLGRVVDPLGRPLDGAGPIVAEAYHPVERPAPEIIERDLVAEPLETGILVIDALFALGRGQRELIIGDHATGKTSIAVDTIVNQKHGDVISVYVAVGQRATAVERVVAAVRQHAAPERCIFVVASAAAAPGLQWIAPFAGFTMAEYFRDRGGHALVVIDDLSRHAATHRELALLTREPPGREAYPGDVFYLHARLLERAAKLAPELGGGSLTALPIAETDASNLSAYIPTNLISITDGQIVLNSQLFAANQRPAVDVGLSVSRVGGKAQRRVLRDVAGRLRLDYAQFLELELFTRFGGISDTRVGAQITRGERIRALLVQPRFANLRVADQVALLAALDAGVFDTISPDATAAVRQHLADHLDATEAEASAAVTRTDTLDDALRTSLVAAVRRLAQDAGVVTDRLGAVAARIRSVRQLSAVITAMRGIAAARSRAARAQLDGVRAYANIVAQAIGQALALVPPEPPPARETPAGGHAVIALCAEQGFAGVFSERVLEAAWQLADAVPASPAASQHSFLVIGDRGLMLSRERHRTAAWSARMAMHPGETAGLANLIAEALYERLADRSVTRATLVHAVPSRLAVVKVMERPLVPFDFARFTALPGAVAPLLTMPAPRLLAQLVDEYIVAELCEALVLSLAAENEARMRAMVAARTNITRTLVDLVSRSQQLRQEEITNEIIELGSNQVGR